ncbi:MAG: hypothetical protein MRERV_9c009 [Mycoplasmataceae bacterium RV_VA103A]|nr:MAG: hypothetical protein MRERV_9c009 [Mycoplasmataceae bacterium RV_VA103A]
MKTKINQKEKFCVVIVWDKESQKCLSASAICELNIKSGVIERLINGKNK